MKRIVSIAELGVDDIPIAGGKAANLGELTAAGFNVPPGFVLTTAAYDYFMEQNGLMKKVEKALKKTVVSDDRSLQDASARIRSAFEEVQMPGDLKDEILKAYKGLFKNRQDSRLVAVRSSATAEDLPTASFAGQQDTFLNVSNPEDLLDKVRKCWSSLFTPRAIAYRSSKGFDQKKIKLAVVVQRMVSSKVSGIMFTVDPNSELPHIIIEAGYGLGEAMVGGKVTPDTYVVDKFHRKIINKRIARQTWRLVRGKGGDSVREDVDSDLANKQKITDEEILALADIGNQIELHYDKPMDIEWCIEDGETFVVQARPVTTLSSNSKIGKLNHVGGKEMRVERAAESGMMNNVIVRGMAASPGLAHGPVRVLEENMSLDVVKEGDVLVTSMTSPDMVPAMTRAAAIVTDEGGMTCHAAIVARELGIPCIVGATNATKILKEGMIVTVDGKMGVVYEGAEQVSPETKPTSDVVARSVPVTGTKILVNIGVPQKAEEYAKLPVSGVGLMRIEFLFTSFVAEHPLALIEQGRSRELVDKLAEGIAIVGKAFYPRPVILRTSDFKTNEYREMKGGEKFEPHESNPMIGWRGCSRYVSEQYKEAFKLELVAVKKAREEMGLKNIWVMLPFVRTVDELKNIATMMKDVGLERGRDFKLYLMAEVPCNIFMAEEFADHCDGFSIGSNDLTQLIMGADRDSDRLGKMGYFDERNEAIKRAIEHLIRAAHKKSRVVSICGQAPSVYPEFAEFLVRSGIDSISLNPDTVVSTISQIASVEQKIILESISKSTDS
ncbi:MAG: phosphoenolpyruvate synthase [Methanomassiliicoccales archaeon]|nr:phosphoenolpyruvate synthase [Methanomassiliicoccales archaeon]